MISITFFLLLFLCTSMLKPLFSHIYSREHGHLSEGRPSIELFWRRHWEFGLQQVKQGSAHGLSVTIPGQAFRGREKMAGSSLPCLRSGGFQVRVCGISPTCFSNRLQFLKLWIIPVPSTDYTNYSANRRPTYSGVLEVLDSPGKLQF